MAGQMNRGTFIGDMIYNLSLMKCFDNYVEVGTWNGEGSTKCVMDGLLQRPDDNSCLYSVEANIEFYNQAKAYWETFGLVEPNRLHLLYGRLIEIDELISIEEIERDKNFHENPWLEWRERNIKEYGECENVIERLPEEIDVLLLDGGQFSTRIEYEKLKDRIKVIVLDDTTTFKTKDIKNKIVASPDEWTTIFDIRYERAGIFMACKSEFEDLFEWSAK